MKVALYARVSSDQQAEKNNSIPSQLRLLHEYTLEQRWLSSSLNCMPKEMGEVFIGTNVQEQRNFLKKFIEKVIVKDGGIEIVYYAPGAKSPSLTLPDA